jgi:hypothetical protein
VRDAIGQETSEFAVARLIVGEQIAEVRAVARRAGKRRQLLECLSRGSQRRGGVAVVMLKQKLQRRLDAGLAIAQIERQMQARASRPCAA